jgi:hypothetical protein
VQRAVLILGSNEPLEIGSQLGIENAELAAARYGDSTAAAVLDYKTNHDPPIINTSYQKQADSIVGKMTIVALDEDLLDIPSTDPRINPDESNRIQQVLDQERLGTLLAIQTTLESLPQVQAAFRLAVVDPDAAAGLMFTQRFAIDGLDRFFAVNLQNHESFLPKIIANYQKYLKAFARLSLDQSPADYGFLLRHALLKGKDGTFFLDHGLMTARTPWGGRIKAFTRCFSPLVTGSSTHPWTPCLVGCFTRRSRGSKFTRWGTFTSTLMMAVRSDNPRKGVCSLL